MKIMKINYVNGDLLTVADGLILHGVNCQHKFNAGIAKQIRIKYPEVYKTYMSSPKGTDMLGEFVPVAVSPWLTVGNCYTQEYYGNDGKIYANLTAIHQSLTSAFLYAILNSIYRISMPKIGAGLGGLKWQDVDEVIRNVYNNFSNDVQLNIFYL